MVESFSEINAAFPWFFPVVVFLLGAAVGSFLNVCIYRIPAGRSVVSPRSACACGQPIAWYDNIPILSWIILRGRARCCGRLFSIRYPAIELLTAVIFVLCWNRLPVSQAIPGMILSSVLICATFIDFDHMIIPDRFTIGTAVVGVIISATVPALHVDPSGAYIVDAVRAFIASLAGVLVGSGVVLWIALLAEAVLKKEAMGFGDVKFLGAIGAFLGWQGSVFAVFGGAIIGTLGFAVIMLWQGMRAHRHAGKGDDPLGFGKQTPFGPMLALAALLYMLWLREPVNAYFRTVSEMLYAS